VAFQVAREVRPEEFEKQRESTGDDVNQRVKCTTHGRVVWATHMRVKCAKMAELIVV